MKIIQNSAGLPKYNSKWQRNRGDILIKDEKQIIYLTKVITLMIT